VKRASALVRLSRDHHQALVAAQTLRRATATSACQVRETFLAFWDHNGARHFRIEEDVLLPTFAETGDAYDPLVARALCDHVAIRAAVALLRKRSDPVLADLRGLGERLAAHVRMEERELFPLIERTLPPIELDLLADRVERAELG
jgi:hemerythrin-like domain-containing protein